MKRTKLWVKIRESFWFSPVLFSILAIILAYLAIKLDYYYSDYKTYLPRFLITTVNTEVQIASTLATSILTMMSITFSAIMVVLTTFSSQFSPRTLQDFIMDRGTQRTLAIFVAGITYNLLIMLFIKGANTTTMFFSPVISIILALFCILGYVYFIHHVAKWVQVNELINKVSLGAVGTIHRVKQELNDHQKFKPDLPLQSVRGNNEEIIDIKTKKSGYIGLFDTKRLVQLAKKDDVVIEFLVHLGTYVIEEKNLMRIYATGDDSQIKTGEYTRCVKVNNERTDVQDVEFGIQKLVEIALRAISPSVNDPHTAINCINRIAALISEIDKNHLEASQLYDTDGKLRIIYKPLDLYHYLYKGFYQIRHYGRADVSVMTAIFHAFGLIAENASKEMKATVYRFAMEIKEGVDHSDYLAMDEAYLYQEIEFLKTATEKDD